MSVVIGSTCSIHGVVVLDGPMEWEENDDGKHEGVVGSGWLY